MATLVKVTHAAIAEGKDPRIEVQRRLLNYRNTVHPSTGKTPASLMMNRKIRTKLPAIIKPSTDKAHREARETDAKTREERKRKLDKRRSARDIEYKVGDKVQIKQKKTTTQPPFDPKPYKITEVEGVQVTAKRGDKIMTRHKGKWKLVRERPIRLQPTPRESPEEEESDDDWCYDLDFKQQEAPVQTENTDMTATEDGSTSGDSEDSRFTITYDDQEDREVEEQEAEPPETSSPIANRTRNKTTRTETVQTVQLSPRERKRRQAQAVKRNKQPRT